MSTSPHYRGVKDDTTIKKVGDKWEIKPTALDVTWGDDSRYWSIDKNKDSTGFISLLQVSWLEVTGTFERNDPFPLKLDKAKIYSVKFKVTMKPDAFGWNGCPVYLMVKDVDDERKNKFRWKKVDLTQRKAGKDSPANQEFFLETHTFRPPPDEKVIFGLFEIWRGRWKGGLDILQVIIEEEGPP